MKKVCKRCSVAFMCREDRVDVCQCGKVYLTQGMRRYVRENFDDCLCGKCLNEIKNNFETCDVNPIYKKAIS